MDRSRNNRLAHWLKAIAIRLPDTHAEGGRGWIPSPHDDDTRNVVAAAKVQRNYLGACGLLRVPHRGSVTVNQPLQHGPGPRQRGNNKRRLH
eukprot:290380-Rhodomonas_salina.4